jgi:O-antigen/teichoic acid export membrane protein
LTRARWIRSDVSWIVVIGFLTQVVTVVSGPLVARMLGASGRGHLVMVTVITVICAHLATTSLSQAIASTVARHGLPARDVLGSDALHWARLSIVPAAAAGVATYFLVRSAPFLPVLMVESFLITLLACWLNIVSGMLQGEHSARRLVQTRLVFSVTYVVAVVLAFVSGRVEVAAFVLPCPIVAQALALVLNLRVLHPSRESVSRGTGGASDEVLSFARQAYVSTLGSTDMLGLDNVLVRFLLGNAVLGLYAIAVSATTLPGIVVSGLATTLLARMSAREPTEAAALMRRWLLAGLAIGLVMVTGMEVVIAPAIRILFGQEFVPATHAAQILIVAAGVSGLRYMLSSAAQAQGWAARASAIDLASGAVLLITMAVGTRLYGLEGAALGVLATGVFKCVGLCLVISWTGRGVRRRPATPVAETT